MAEAINTSSRIRTLAQYGAALGQGLSERVREAFFDSRYEGPRQMGAVGTNAAI